MNRNSHSSYSELQINALKSVNYILCLMLLPPQKETQGIATAFKLFGEHYSYLLNRDHHSDLHLGCI